MSLIRAASRRVPKSRPTYLPAPDRPRLPIAVCHNPNGGNEEGLGEKRISHVLTAQEIDISMLNLLSVVVDAWPFLLDDVRAKILAIVRASDGRTS